MFVRNATASMYRFPCNRNLLLELMLLFRWKCSSWNVVGRILPDCSELFSWKTTFYWELRTAMRHAKHVDRRWRRREGRTREQEGWVNTCRPLLQERLRSVWHENAFFHYIDVNNRMNSKLTLCDIMELAYLFVLEIPVALWSEKKPPMIKFERSIQSPQE